MKNLLIMALAGTQLLCVTATECEFPIRNEDGSAYLCSSPNSASIWTNEDVMMASFSDNLEAIPTTLNVLTGGVCDVIYETQGHECFENVMTIVAEQFMPRDSDDVNQFQNQRITFKAQTGNCFDNLYDFEIIGLDRQFFWLAKSIRDSEVGHCQIQDYSNRKFMATLWGFPASMGALFGGIALAITYIASVVISGCGIVLACGIPVGVLSCCAGAAGKSCKKRTTPLPQGRRVQGRQTEL